MASYALSILYVSVPSGHTRCLHTALCPFWADVVSEAMMLVGLLCRWRGAGTFVWLSIAGHVLHRAVEATFKFEDLIPRLHSVAHTLSLVRDAITRRPLVFSLYEIHSLSHTGPRF